MTSYSRKSIDELIADNQGIQLDIGCGGAKQKGFIGMDVRDISGIVDIVHDWNDIPWPLPNDCVRTAIASHVIEHINPADFGFINFMNEVWRIMKPGGQFAIVTPYGGSPGFWQDPTHINGCNEATWAYFDPIPGQWSEGGLYTIYRPKPWQVENLAWNTIGNIEVLLRKRKEDPSYYGEDKKFFE